MQLLHANMHDIQVCKELNMGNERNLPANLLTLITFQELDFQRSSFPHYPKTIFFLSKLNLLFLSQFEKKIRI
jgi:hypothetical protein